MNLSKIFITVSTLVLTSLAYTHALAEPLGPRGDVQFPSNAGMLTAVDRNYVRGWAEPQLGEESARIWLFSQDEGAEAELHLIPMANFGQEGFRRNPAVAAHKLEPHEGLRSVRGIDFKMITPESLNDGRNHRIYAFTVNHPDKEHMLAGSPRVFNSNLYYKQEAIENLRWNAQVAYLPEVLQKYKHLRDGLLEPNAAREENSGRTVVAAWTAPTNPYARAINRSISNITGLESIPGNSNALLGIDSGPKGTQALQTSGTAIGISLAPRAMSRKPIDWGLFSGTNWSREAEPKPFAINKDNRIRVQGWFKHPYTGITSIADHSIGREGIAFYYYTLQFADRAHERVTADGRRVSNTIWFDVRLYQDKFARPHDTWDQLKNKEGLAVDPSDKQNQFGVIDSVLRSSSKRITVPTGSALFSTRPYQGEKPFCFEIDGFQLEKSIAQLNRAHLVPQTYSTNCRDYSLISFNIDMESWNPTPRSDARIGLSFRDVTIRLIPAGDVLPKRQE